MRIVWFLALPLAACSADPPAPSPESNVAVARGSEPQPVPTASSAVAGVPPPRDALPSATPSPSPRVTTTEAEQDAEAARAVVGRYFRLIGRGDYVGAHALWDDSGEAAGIDEAAFGQRFRRIEAAVGRPGRVEAGAGQRYTEVPVALTGTLKDGTRYAARGTVTLHRAGPIDGATSEQRSWRLAKSDLLPPRAAATTAAATATPSPAPAIRTARYRCGDGTLMLVRFDAEGDTADVELGGALLGKLDGQKPASGIWYKRGDIELSGKGEEATLARPDAPAITCMAEG